MGFYVSNAHRFSIKADLSTFTEKTFESLTIEVEISKKKFLLSCIYRSPSPLPNTTPIEQINAFYTTLDTHLSNLNSQSNNAYVFLDANINLLNLNTNPLVITYIETFLNNGYTQLISRAT